MIQKITITTIPIFLLTNLSFLCVLAYAQTMKSMEEPLSEALLDMKNASAFTRSKTKKRIVFPRVAFIEIFSLVPLINTTVATRVSQKLISKRKIVENLSIP